MKPEVWFNKRRKTTADDLIATYRALGMSDEEIIAEMKRIQAAKSQPAETPAPGGNPGKENQWT